MSNPTLEEYEALLEEARQSLIKVEMAAVSRRNLRNALQFAEDEYHVAQHGSGLIQSKVFMHYLQLLRAGVITIDKQ